MKTKIKQRIIVNPVCKECGFPIARYQKYWMHDDETILCEKCFKKLKKRGKIK